MRLLIQFHRYQLQQAILILSLTGCVLQGCFEDEAEVLASALDRAVASLDETARESTQRVGTDVRESVDKALGDLNRLSADLGSTAIYLEEDALATVRQSVRETTKTAELLQRALESQQDSAVLDLSHALSRQSRNTTNELESLIRAVDLLTRRSTERIGGILVSTAALWGSILSVLILSVASLFAFRRPRGRVAALVASLLVGGTIYGCVYVFFIRTQVDPEVVCSQVEEYGSATLADPGQLQSSDPRPTLRPPTSPFDRSSLLRDRLRLAPTLPGGRRLGARLRTSLGADLRPQPGSRSIGLVEPARRACGFLTEEERTKVKYIWTEGSVCALHGPPLRAELAEKYRRLAARCLGYSLSCLGDNECLTNELCDEQRRECRVVGDMCRTAAQCGAGRECHTRASSCVPRGDFRCSSSAKCRVGEHCIESTCTGSLGGACQSGRPGVCSAGKWSKVAGVISCESLRGPEREQCNGLDDDCDGMTDELPPARACEAQSVKGICRGGQLVCRDGRDECKAAPQEVESCNGLDDDCDGLIDENKCLSVFKRERYITEMAEEDTLEQKYRSGFDGAPTPPPFMLHHGELQTLGGDCPVGHIRAQCAAIKIGGHGWCIGDPGQYARKIGAALAGGYNDDAQNHARAKARRIAGLIGRFRGNNLKPGELMLLLWSKAHGYLNSNDPSLGFWWRMQQHEDKRLGWTTNDETICECRILAVPLFDAGNWKVDSSDLYDVDFSNLNNHRREVECEIVISTKKILF